ncbi:reverse transcriptase domain-containing protein [Citrus sinensis]|nr:reverse transcriptase domain-containing protein [Citrus sinensis]
MGGNDRSLSMVAEFRDAVRECKLVDIECRGYPFTWSNRRFGPHFVEEKLDRFFGSKEWEAGLSELVAYNLDTWCSDHTPIMLKVQTRIRGVKFHRRRRCRLHYEDMWSPYDDCKRIVKEEWETKVGWDKNDPVQCFNKATKDSMVRLLSWNRQHFGDRKKKVEQLKKRLVEMKLNQVQYEEDNEMVSLEKRIENLRMDEEIYWRQRSRVEWLKEGDRNTKFFHAKASSRKKKNRIWGIMNKQNSWVEDEEEVDKQFCDYFAELFTTSNPNSDHILAALGELTPTVTDEMNQQLDSPFSAEEIYTTLSQMSPTKAPGPDGLPAAFYQKHWLLVRYGVINTCLHILNNGGDIAPLNHTHIALIPKVSKPSRVTDFRPISLCNVIYRIVAKTIANRLKHILHYVIAPTQSAFIPNRLISDNTIIGYECLHKIRHSKGKKHGLVALKLDVSKAYDRVEWPFLKQIMLRMGFSQRWVDRIMNCISTVSFSVILNGVAKGFFHPQRGLRQGCPLSPYLFIMCAEAFSNLIRQAEHQKLIHGLNFGKDLTISHLLFADDSLIFARATADECRNLKRVFECYERALGQIFNMEKSSMFFSSITKPEHVAQNFFSCGGKEILIKAVAQAVPTYAMSVFKLPQGLCDDMQKEIAKFWWGSSKEKKNIHWSSIIWGRKVLENGCRWRVGNGQQINIHNGSWIPRPTTFKPILSPIFPKEASVAELIDDNNCWKEELIYQHFGKDDAEIIVHIPLPRQQNGDTLIWHYDKRGNYLIRSGYQLALKKKHQDIPSCSNQNPSQWNIIWKLMLPEKVKIFLWRAAKNLLPTAENLREKRVMQEATCPICKKEIESTAHALLFCKFARKVWRYSSLGIDLKTEKFPDVITLLHHSYHHHSNLNGELVASFLWVIWNARNNWLFKGKCDDPSRLIAKAMSTADCVKRIKQPEQNFSLELTSMQQSQWSPPSEDWVKVNVDAAMDEQNNLAGLGAVIRNYRGEVVAAAVNTVKSFGDVEMCEARAALWGIQAAIKAGASSIILESDSKRVVELINSKQSTLTELFWVIFDILEAKKSFQNFKAQHVGRTCNTLAHNLAKLALRKSEPCIWLDEFPAEILYLFSL